MKIWYKYGSADLGVKKIKKLLKKKLLQEAGAIKGPLWQKLLFIVFFCAMLLLCGYCFCSTFR